MKNACPASNIVIDQTLFAAQTVSPALLQDIEDAVLLGHVDELDHVLKVVTVDPDFPEDVRYGLEALRHYRAHYGPNWLLEPKQYLLKRRAILTENAWGAEMLSKIRRMRDIRQQKQA